MNTINIGGHIFKIIYLLEDQLENKFSGKIIYNTLEIFIDGKLCRERQEEVIAHEIVHGLLEKAGLYEYLNNKKVSVEQICCGLENIFWRFLKDNTNFYQREEVKDETTNKVSGN